MVCKDNFLAGGTYWDGTQVNSGVLVFERHSNFANQWFIDGHVTRNRGAALHSLEKQTDKASPDSATFYRISTGDRVQSF